MEQQLIKNKTSYFEIKKSQFYGYVYQVTSLSEVNQYLATIRLQHPKATHVCFAYIIHQDGVYAKYDDDNEPSKTSGFAIYNLLTQMHIINILAISVRYYGHVKLGASGLIHAYSRSIKLCCDNNLEPFCKQYLYTIQFAYCHQKEVTYWLNTQQAIIIKKQFLPTAIILEISCSHLLNPNKNFFENFALKNK